jgi:hypothetical protein
LTTSEFLEYLTGIRHKFEWTLGPDAVHQPERRKHPRSRILGTPRDADVSLALDPLRAVCYVRTNRIFEAGAWSDVADALGMDLPSAAALLAASNQRTWTGAGEDRVPAEHLISIRRQVLIAVGLDTLEDERHGDLEEEVGSEARGRE